MIEIMVQTRTTRIITRVTLVLLILGFSTQSLFSQANPFLSPRTPQTPRQQQDQAQDLTPIPIPFEQLYGTDESKPFDPLTGFPDQSSGSIPLFQRFLQIQISLSRVMSDTLISIQDERNLRLVFVLLGITFLFGIVHTLGVGHRKTVLIGWILNSKPSYLQITTAAVLLGIFHTLGTGIILLIASVIRDVLGGTLLQTREVVQVWANFFSGIVVFILGIYLIKKSWGHSHLPGGFSHHTHEIHDSQHEAHDHHENCSCKSQNSSVLDLAKQESPIDLGDRKTLFMVAGSMGLVPCPGSLSVLAVSFLLGDLVLGLLAVGIISLGTIFTLGLIGFTLRFFLGKALVLSKRSHGLAKIFDVTMQVIQVGAAVVVLGYGGMLTLGGALTLFF